MHKQGECPLLLLHILCSLQRLSSVLVDNMLQRGHTDRHRLLQCQRVYSIIV